LLFAKENIKRERERERERERGDIDSRGSSIATQEMNMDVLKRWMHIFLANITKRGFIIL